ncbi:ATP-binding protein [Pseudonocardia xishanensis]|uniref:LuxR family transcriptional regulator n=1 Tax=Pseudonocardia xishanensis TaxID=630995 RepID=A0ABP8RHA4_9PSEU
MTLPPRPGLVGRDEELRALVERVEACAEVGGVVLALVGEPGIGRTTVLAGLAERMRGVGFRVLAARGAQSEVHLPFAGLHQILRPLLGGADRLPPLQREALLACFAMSDPPDAQPFFISLAVLELLVDAAAEAPVLLCLDDPLLVDQPSLDVIAFVLRRIADQRIAVVCTSRGEPLPFADGDALTQVHLAPLPGPDSADLLGSRAPGLPRDLRDRILREANGNPLALLEFAAAVESGRAGGSDDGLPMTTRLERAFAARADGLDAPSRVVVDVAALHDGEDVDDILAAAALLDPAAGRRDAVAPALDLGLLVLSGDVVRIAHPLVGSALRHAMPPATRRAVHAALARVLATRPDRAIWHEASSAPGPDERIAAGLERAAADARRRGAVSTAVLWLERAAALSPDPHDRASRLLDAAEAGHELGRFAQVQQIAARVADLPLRARDRSRLTWLEGAFHDGATSEPAEIRHLVTLARRATTDDETDLAMQLLIGAARRVWWRDPGERVRDEIVGAAREVPLAAEDPRRLAALGLAEPLVFGAEIMDRLDGWPADAHGRPDVAGVLGIAAFCVGDFGRATAFLSAPIRQLRAEGRLGLLAEALALRSWAEINLGVFDASRSADEGLRLAEETGQAVWAATAGAAVAVIDAVAGRWDLHHPLLTDAEETALRLPNASSSLLAGVQLARGVAALGAERPEPAFDELHRVFVRSDPAHQQVQQIWALSYLADAAVHTDRREPASGLLAAMEKLTASAQAAGSAIPLEYARAVLADDADPERAEELFRAGLDGAGRDLPWHRARLQLAYGSWLRRQRRSVDSRGPLRAARSTFDTLGATTWAHRADRELRATGERGWRPTQSLRGLLSPQETQIAELAAQGLSNREIGQRMFLSHRTVGSHLYRIFPKLGVTNRSQLAGALGQSSDASPAPQNPSPTGHDD